MALAAVLAAGAAWWWWTADERAIRAQVATIARALTVAPDEGALGPVTRVAALRNVLAPEILVSVGPLPAQAGAGSALLQEELIGRDAVLGLVGRWVPPSGGLMVRFVDVQVAVRDGRSDADVRGTVVVTAHTASHEPSVDARDLSARFARLDGTWRLATVRLEETLQR